MSEAVALTEPAEATKDDIYRELAERESRKTNIIIYGLKESSSPVTKLPLFSCFSPTFPKNNKRMAERGRPSEEQKGKEQNRGNVSHITFCYRSP